MLWRVVALLVSLLLTHRIGQLANLVIADEGALDPFHLHARIIQHITFADQFFGAGRIQDGGRVNTGNRTEGDTGREVRLDQAGNHVHGRTLRSQDYVDTGRTSLLRQSDNGSGDAPGEVPRLGAGPYRHGKVCILIDHRHNIRKELVSLVRTQLAIAVFLVIQLDVVYIRLAQEFVALVHFHAERSQDLVGHFRLLHNCGASARSNTFTFWVMV